MIARGSSGDMSDPGGGDGSMMMMRMRLGIKKMRRIGFAGGAMNCVGRDGG